MSGHRAEAHAAPKGQAFALTFGGCMAAAAISLASADVPVAAGSPPRGEPMASHSIEPPTVASAQEPASPADPPAAAPASAPASPASPAASAPATAPTDREGEYFIEAGLGQTFGPSTFLLSATGGKFIDPHLAIGPTLQLGVDDNETIFAPTFGVRRTFDLDSADLRKLEPYVEGGVGFAYLEDDRRGGDDDDIGFLLTFGMGANFELQRNLALGTGVLVNLMPGEVLDERLFVSWRILQLNFTF